MATHLGSDRREQDLSDAPGVLIGAVKRGAGGSGCNVTRHPRSGEPESRTIWSTITMSTAITSFAPATWSVARRSKVPLYKAPRTVVPEASIALHISCHHRPLAHTRREERRVGCGLHPSHRGLVDFVEENS